MLLILNKYTSNQRIFYTFDEPLFVFRGLANVEYDIQKKFKGAAEGNMVTFPCHEKASLCKIP